jgi:hypothetical protein
MILKTKKHNFIMIGQGRSGSTLLKQLLDSHPYICCEGELYNVKENYITNKLIRKIAYTFPIYTFYYRNYLAKTKVYGFTLLFSDHKRKHYILKQLTNRNWKIIHFYRNDIIEQVFSHLVAVESGLWHRNMNNQSELANKITINKDDFFKRIKNLVNQKTNELELLKNFDHHTVIYETDLLDNNEWQKTCDDLFRFLGIESDLVKASLSKTYSKKYSEIVQNHDALMEDLAKSDYSFLLSDQNHRLMLNHL